MSHNVQHQMAAIMRRRGTILSFAAAMRLLAPYSPRLAYNFLEPANSLFQGNTLTPVTAVTNPVGVVIDQTQGGLGNLGAELKGTGTVGLTGTATAATYNTSTGEGAVTRVDLSNQSFVSVSGLTATSRYVVQIANTGAASLVIRQNGSSGTTVLTVASGVTTLLLFTGSTTCVFTSAGGLATFTLTSFKEIPGYHATASSDAKRPLFARRPATGRRNLFEYSEDFGNAYWTKTGGSITDNTSGNPLNGEVTADRFVESGGGANNHGISRSYTSLAADYTLSFYFKPSDLLFAEISFDQSVGTNVCVVDLTTGATFSSTGVTVAASALANGWWRFAVTATLGAGTRTLRVRFSNTSGSFFYAGNGTRSLELFGAQLEQSATATNYQRVVTSADITEAGVRDVYAALFDGSDDCLQVSGFDMSNTDEVCVIAGVRKLSDTAIGVALELTDNSSTNTGVFAFLAPPTASANYRMRSGGTTIRDATSPTDYPSPTSNHIDGIGHISGDKAELRINGVSIVTNSSDQGTGNYSNSTLNIGGRNNSASLPFNGAISYLFVLGAIPPDAVLTKVFRGLAPQIGVSV